MENKLTQLDPDQITRYSFDEDLCAIRMVQVNETGNSGSVLKIPEIITKTEIKEIEKTVVVKEYEKLEIPTIVKESIMIEVPKIVSEVVTIEKPIFIEKTIIEKIEVPVIVKETEIVQIKQEFNKEFRLIFFSLIIMNVGLVILNLIK